MTTLQIRKARSADLGPIYRCHQAAFPKSLSARLGGRFGQKMLSWYLYDPNAYLWVAEENNRIIGYLGAQALLTPGQRGAAGSILQFTSRESGIALLLRPWLWFHREVLKKLKSRIGIKSKPNHYQPLPGHYIPGTPRFGLIVIGLDPKHQGGGAASRLEEIFCAQARELKIPSLTLTVHMHNRRAQAFYEKRGWIQIARNLDSCLYQKNLEI